MRVLKNMDDFKHLTEAEIFEALRDNDLDNPVAVAVRARTAAFKTAYRKTKETGDSEDFKTLLKGPDDTEVKKMASKLFNTSTGNR